jgi:Protein of unknown function (DUF1353)
MLLAGASFAFLRAAPATAQQSDKTDFMKAAIADINARNEKVDQDTARAVKETGQAPLFLKIPKVTPFVDWDYYFLEGTLEWIANPGQNFSPVEVPKGFVTDLASVPAILWSIFPKAGRYAYAAIVHDYLYWTQAVSREEADSVLKAAMEDAKVDVVSQVGFYAAVRTFGASPWERNRKAKGAGEKRVSSNFQMTP